MDGKTQVLHNIRKMCIGIAEPTPSPNVDVLHGMNWSMLNGIYSLLFGEDCTSEVYTGANFPDLHRLPFVWFVPSKGTFRETKMDQVYGKGNSTVRKPEQI